MNSQDAATFTALEEQLRNLFEYVNQLLDYLRTTRSAAIPDNIYSGLTRISTSLSNIQDQTKLLEEERQSFRVLSQIGQVVNSSLDVDVVLQIVMDTVIRLTGAERGFLMLRDENNALVIRTARNWEQEDLDSGKDAVSKTVVNRVISIGRPILTTNAQEDPRFATQDSIVALNLRSIICVPLKLKGEITGVMYVDNRMRSGLFTRKELDILVSFSNHAAVALDNARLFASVHNALDEVTELKNLMDNVFTSITSGVLTADIRARITLCNRAAEQIMGKTAEELIGNDIEDVLSPIAPFLEPYIEHVIKEDRFITGIEGSASLSNERKLDLRLNLSPLKDAEQITQGVAIVLEDLTERKKLEAQRRLFGRMVSPAVIEQIDPEKIQLGGQRSEITVLFADIRGYTSFSEDTKPEQLIRILNFYLAAAVEAILHQEGTIDKFLGDGVMAWFNAPVTQSDHAMRAIKSAIRMQDTLQVIHEKIPPKLRLDFGVGIHTGDAVLGLVGTERRLEYTAIGDMVNTAKRIQENCKPGSVLISGSTFEKVKESVVVQPNDSLRVKGKRTPVEVYQLLKLKNA